LRSVRTVVAVGPAGAHTALVVAVDGKRAVVDRLLLVPEAAWGYTALAEAVGTVADDFETKSSSHDWSYHRVGSWKPSGDLPIQLCILDTPSRGSSTR
jgi:hypothetical protein